MTPSRRRGRRDNGLDAISYRPMRDVDPRVGEHLLDVLRAAGIAAYLDPTSDTDAVTRSIALPSPPSDRLYVDRAELAAATALIADYDSDLRADTASESDGSSRAVAQSSAAVSSSVDDATWQTLVSTYERDHGRLGDTLTDSFDRTASARAEQLDDEARAATLAEDEHPAEADEEHYEPPPPPPLPVLSRAAAYALVLLTGGALLLVAPGLIGLSGQVGFVLGVFGIAGGVGMLIWQMREDPDDDDPDDGAIV